MSVIKAAFAALLVSASVCLLTTRYWLPTAPAAVTTEPYGDGLDIPSIGLGTWLSNRSTVAHAVEFALKSGYRHIDAALIYKNEDEVGRGIRAANIPRDKLWVTSKLWNAHHRYMDAQTAIRQTIQDLGVGYLDLYLIHWPVAFVPGQGTRIDKDTTIIDTWQVMENIARSNLTRKIGISNFSRQDVEKIMEICQICPYAHEFETHPYLQQQEFVDYHRDIGVKVIAYSPLANTNPTYGDSNRLAPILEDPFWAKLAEEKNATVAQTILAWGHQRDTIIIPKSVHEKYTKQNLGALDISFTESEMRDIAKQDKKTRMNNPGREWRIKLFADLDDPTRLRDDDGTEEL
ncbi:aldo/keto reductase [Nemania sp. NC0429]|nr:aldo/keto reductase [Nemania sp. NC0429]